MNSAFTPRTHCAACGSSVLKPIIDYGCVPLAGCFPAREELETVEAYPLALLFCPGCKLVQTDGTIDPDLLFKDYRYLSSVGLSRHFSDVANYLHQRLELSSAHKVVEIGSNDGVFLAPMMQLGCDVVGFEPSSNVSRIARDRGCTVINEYFSIASARQHLARASVDLFFAANCFAHIDDINGIVEAIRYVLRPTGTAVIEVHDVSRLVDELQYDFVYQEHAYYYSLTSLSNLFAAHGMTLVDFEEIPVHSGSLRVYVRNQLEATPPSVQHRLDQEAIRAASWEYYAAFADDVRRHRNRLMELVRGIKGDGYRIVGYGASGRANVTCNFCGIGTDLVDYIVDESPERYGRYVPGQGIPIEPKAVFDDDDAVDYVLIFAWNFSKMIMHKLEARKLKFIIPFPEPHVVESISSLQRLNSL